MEQASTVSAAFIFPARSSVVHTMSWRTDDWRVMKKRTTILAFNIFSLEYKVDKILKLSVLFIFQLICSHNIHHQIAQPQLHLIHASHHSTISWICVMILKIRHNIVLSIKFSHTMHWKHVFIICFFQIRYFKFESWRQQVFLCVPITNQISGLTTLGTGWEERSEIVTQLQCHGGHNHSTTLWWWIGSCSDS